MTKSGIKHIILGTAGHIDHGKTTLIKALTGVDCDRLKEEKERGITIELGFTSLDLPGGIRIGIIDVPGHERFVHHMVAGVVGMDLVLLVIAADEGIMPQTREHLDICRLLGVERGLTAITKADCVDGEWLDLVKEEVENYVQGSFLANSPVIPVSSTTGEGLPSLLDALGGLVGTLPEHTGEGAFRLPVDRVFTMKGFGTVVTGTLVSGGVRVGDTVEVLPRQIKARVRGIQVHNEKVDYAQAGQRTALNLQGVEREELRRGDVICAPDLMHPGYLLDVRLTLLENAPPLKHRTRIRFHTGTAEVFGRVALLDREELAPGDTCMLQIRLEERIAAMPRDRFVIRRYSPLLTLGGGEIIDSHPEKHKRFRQEIIEDLATLSTATVPETVEFHIRKAGGSGMDLKALAGVTNLDAGTIAKALASLREEDAIILVDEANQRSVHTSFYNGFRERICGILREFHDRNPLKGGMSKEELKARLSPDMDARLYGRLLDDLERQGEIQVRQEHCSLAQHQVSLSPEERRVYDRILVLFKEAGIQPPGRNEALESLKKDRNVAERLIDLLIDEGKLVRLKGDLLFHHEAIEHITKQVQDFLKDGTRMDIGAFKEMTGLSRKFSVPLLEYLDARGVTMRVGDARVLRRKVS